MSCCIQRLTGRLLGRENCIGSSQSAGTHADTSVQRQQRGSAGELGAEFTTSPVSYNLLSCSNLSRFFFKKSKVCREMVYTNTYLLIFVLLPLGVWKKLVSFWTRCPYGWRLKSLPGFSDGIIWLNKRYCLSLQTLFLLHNMAAQIMAVVYILTN